MRRPLIAGNWKMNHLTEDAVAFAESLRPRLEGADSVDVALFPPFTLLATLARAMSEDRVALGGQDCWHEESGAFTGEVAPSMLVDVGASLVLVGHSERRSIRGETDELCARKLRAAIGAGLVGVLCVGETEDEREGGRTREVLARQLATALDGGDGIEPLGEAAGAHLVVAYEPVWAIGTGRTATPAIVREAHAFLRERLAEHLGPERAEATRLLYGGSVKPENAAEILACEDVDGGLVGGASLKADTFAELIAIAARS